MSAAGGGGSDLALGPVCNVYVTPQQPTAPATLMVHTDSTLPSPTWQVTLAQADSPPVYHVASDGRSLVVDAMQPGTYSFRVTFGGDVPCSGFGSTDVNAPSGIVEIYRLRALPPSGLGLAPTDTLEPIVGGTPAANRTLNVNGGTAVSGVLTGPAGPIAGEIRFIGTRVPDADTRAGGSGSFTVALSSDLYRPLLIPDSPLLAPHLGDEDLGTNFLGGSFVVGAGVPVTGVVQAGSDPIAGAGVVLRAELLPSGLGTSAADGSFTLQAEPSPPTPPYQLAVSSDGWPTLTLPLDANTLPAAGLDFAIVYTVARVAVTGSVRGSGGAAVAGARVTIESADAIAGAATVTYGGMPHAASGRISRVVTSDATGALPALQLPAGSYVVTVEPPAGATDGLTTFTTTAPGTWSLALAPTITLGGMVKNSLGMGVDGARVTATALSGLGAAPATVTANGGHYSLQVGSGTASNVRVEPTAGVKLSDATVWVAAGATTADVTLGPGLQISGLVVGPNSAPLPSVLIEALCGSCASPMVLKTTVSDANGRYMIYVPDPGQLAVDGGVSADGGS